MTRVRTHHEFVQRPVWDRLGADAFLLHHAALAYVNAHGTDGLLPRVKVKGLHSAVKAPLKQVQGLLSAEMWSEADEEHYRVCDVLRRRTMRMRRGDEQLCASLFQPIRRPKIPAPIRERVFAAADWRCLQCGATEDLTVDHIWPRKHGGTDDLENLQTLCRRCNCRKGVRVDA